VFEKVASKEDLYSLFNEDDNKEDMALYYQCYQYFADLNSQETYLQTPSVTPASTPPRALKIESTTVDLPAEFTFSYQYDWPVGTSRHVKACVESIKPSEPRNWRIMICPSCLEYGKHKCSCKDERIQGYLMTVFLKSATDSKYIIEAYISGPEADNIFSQKQPQELLKMVNDGQSHSFQLLKFVPEIITFKPFGFLILELQ
jgi:hypothetical protein